MNIDDEDDEDDEDEDEDDEDVGEYCKADCQVLLRLNEAFARLRQCRNMMLHSLK